MNKQFATATCFCLSLSGCAAWFSASTPVWPWTSITKPCEAECTETEALNAYVQANTFCREVQNYYEAGGQRAKSNQLAVGAVGSLAGAVAAPLAGGNAAKAWSGLSGATNALQASIEEAFSTTVTTNRRKAVNDAADTAASKYALAGKPNEKVIAAINMARSCAMSSAVADSAALKALLTTH